MPSSLALRTKGRPPGGRGRPEVTLLRQVPEELVPFLLLPGGAPCQVREHAASCRACPDPLGVAGGFGAPPRGGGGRGWRMKWTNSPPSSPAAPCAYDLASSRRSPGLGPQPPPRPMCRSGEAQGPPPWDGVFGGRKVGRQSVEEPRQGLLRLFHFSEDDLWLRPGRRALLTRRWNPLWNPSTIQVMSSSTWRWTRRSATAQGRGLPCTLCPGGFPQTTLWKGSLSRYATTEDEVQHCAHDSGGCLGRSSEEHHLDPLL